jgi:hypothetical protein
MNTAFMAPQKLFRAIRRVKVVSTSYSSFKTSILSVNKEYSNCCITGNKVVAKLALCSTGSPGLLLLGARRHQEYKTGGRLQL